MSTAPDPQKPRANTTAAELHIFLEDAGDMQVQQRQPKYRFEIWREFLGERRRIRAFPVAGNQLERLTQRWAAKFRVPKGNIFDHTQEESTDGEEKDAE